MRKRKLVAFTLFVCLFPCGCLGSVYFPCSTVGWSVVCDGGIFRSNSFFSGDDAQLISAEIRTNLTLNAPISTKVVCFSRLLICLRSLYANSVYPDQTAPTGNYLLGNYLQQTTSADDIFRCIFSWRFKVSTHLSRMEFPNIINWTSPYPF